MFEVQNRNGDTIATADTWWEAADRQTYYQNYWGVQLFIVRTNGETA